MHSNRFLQSLLGVTLGAVRQHRATPNQEAVVDANHSAPVCESGETVIGAGPETVWDTLTDFGTWPQWMPGVKTMHVDEPVGLGTTFRWKTGPGTIRSEIVESDRPRSVAWKGRTLGIDAVHVWRMEDRGDTTRVFTEVSWDGLLARVLQGSTRKTVQKALEDGLSALRNEAERRAQSTS
jgi:carbon monoxide dehydrogenase subunit G